MRFVDVITLISHNDLRYARMKGEQGFFFGLSPVFF